MGWLVGAAIGELFVLTVAIGVAIGLLSAITRHTTRMAVHIPMWTHLVSELVATMKRIADSLERIARARAAGPCTADGRVADRPRPEPKEDPH